MNKFYYIGLDIHKKVIAYCIKKIDGKIVHAGKIAATRKSLDIWLECLPGPWVGAMEATIFTGWIYDYLYPHAIELKVAHPGGNFGDTIPIIYHFTFIPNIKGRSLIDRLGFWITPG